MRPMTRRTAIWNFQNLKRRSLTNTQYSLPPREEWAEATANCPELGPISTSLGGKGKEGTFSQRMKARQQIKTYGLELRLGIILEPSGVKWVPEEYRQLVCSVFHATPFSAHHDAKRTLAHLRRVLYWPGVTEAVRVFCSSCLDCQIVKARIPQVGIEARQIEPIPHEVIAIDHFGPRGTKVMCW